MGDDAWLRLVRYEGGRRGPVLLASGFGMSSTSFLLDTVNTNLAEHLVERGYDVWLFDYRASIDLPSSRTAFSLDDVATTDWPQAVAEVRNITGAGSVQALGHCVGSVSLMMALAAGLSDVRSAVCMQFTLHPVTSYLNQVKAAAKVDKLMGRIGLSKVAPLTGVTVPNTALDLMLRAVPMPRAERCGKALCRWINAIYGCTHPRPARRRHPRPARRHVRHRRPGRLGHMGTIMWRRLAVDRSGTRPTRHPERLRLPILLVQEKNYIFRPAGSMRTAALAADGQRGVAVRAGPAARLRLGALIGRDAAADVFPVLSEHLDRFNR